MYQYKEISHVHLEPTTRCNAGCPMCARNSCGTTAAGLVLEELNLDHIRGLFPESFIKQLSGVDLCGAYGDPGVAKELVEIVEYIRSTNYDCLITIFTNGGVRPPRWWQRLAKALGPNGWIVFGIDGLADTNCVYRRGVNFFRVLENAQAFIHAGGNAQWDFLVFRHNEHQIEEAKRLSKSLKFRRFAVKKTSRFLKVAYDYVPELGNQPDFQRFPIYDHKGEVVGILEPPLNPSLVNETLQLYSNVSSRKESLNRLFSKTSISCRVQENRSIFISASGHAFPCCWTYVQATAPIIYKFVAGVDMQMYDLVQKCGGFGSISALTLGLPSVVQSSLFKAIEDSWKRSSISAGRQKVCARVCGVDFPAYTDQFQTPGLVPCAVKNRD